MSLETTSRPMIHVNIGQLKVGRSPSILKATLGSCVGIGLIWRERRICGLSHSLLPIAPTVSFELNAKYVSQAVPALMALMRIKKENLEEIEAIITGGSHMHQVSQLKNEAVGDHNAEAARRFVKEAGLHIVHSDFGGDRGRTFSIDCTNFSYDIHLIEKSK